MDALPGLLALSRWLDEKGQAVKKNVRNPAGLFAAFEQEVQQGAAKDKSAWDASRSVMPEVRAQGVQEINQRGQELGGLLGTFAGVGAKTADAVKLGKAKDMMKAGADPVQVWQQTGWTNQFPDGKWRFEISDKPAKVKPNPADYGQDRLISESVTHPEYFAAYPQLRDMTGTFDKALKGEQGVGSAGFLEDFPHISVTASAKETKPIAMHELQHVVQGEEGFARGGSPDAIKAKNIPPDALAKLDKLQQRIAETPGGTPERFAAAKAFDDMLQQYTPHGQYRRLAGEAEARLTQARMNLTPAERSARPPWLEFDVPREQQIVRGLLGEQTGPAMSVTPTKFELAHAEAQRNAALPVEQGGLGLGPNNTAAERAKAMGFNGDMYHGTARLDRMLEKPGLDPKRATSGPMPFFTSDPDIASNYAKGKVDTSLSKTDNGNVADYFQVSPKELGYTRSRAPYTVEQSWHHLKPEEKATILDRAKRVGYENVDEATGPFTLHPPGTDASLSGSHFDYLMKTEARGNPLAALRAMWHDGGNLVGSEEELASIFKLAGYPHNISQSSAPWYEAKGILPAKIRMSNPIDTSNSDQIQGLLTGLKKDFKGDRSRTKKYGADQWDKNVKFTPREWVDTLANDVAAGHNSYVWTSIPDKVTAALKQRGFDGIIDKGGKSGASIGHDVFIPFGPEQVRSRFAAFDPKKRDSRDLLASMGLMGLLGAGAYGSEQQ